MRDAPTTPAALVLGAARGFGSALARRLSAKGWRLALSARGQGRLEILSNELNAHAKPADATNAKCVEPAFTAVCEKFGRVDGVVNCCGSLLLKPAHLTTDEVVAPVVTLPPPKTEDSIPPTPQSVRRAPPFSADTRSATPRGRWDSAHTATREFVPGLVANRSVTALTTTQLELHFA